MTEFQQFAQKIISNQPLDISFWHAAAHRAL